MSEEKTRFLSYLREGVILRLPKGMVDRLTIETADDFFTGDWLCKIVTSLVSECRVTENFTVYWRGPMNWWEHLKMQLGLPFRDREIPIMVNVQQYLAYPEADIVIPGLGPMVIRESIQQLTHAAKASS